MPRHRFDFPSEVFSAAQAFTFYTTDETEIGCGTKMFWVSLQATRKMPTSIPWDLGPRSK